MCSWILLSPASNLFSHCVCTNKQGPTLHDFMLAHSSWFFTVQIVTTLGADTAIRLCNEPSWSYKRKINWAKCLPHFTSSSSRSCEYVLHQGPVLTILYLSELVTYQCAGQLYQFFFKKCWRIVIVLWRGCCRMRDKHYILLQSSRKARAYYPHLAVLSGQLSHHVQSKRYALFLSRTYYVHVCGAACARGEVALPWPPNNTRSYPPFRRIYYPSASSICFCHIRLARSLTSR